MKIKTLILTAALAGLVLCSGQPRTALGAKAAAKKKPAAGVHPIVYGNGCLAGGWADGKWLSGDAIAPRMKGGETYKYHNMTKLTGQFRGGRPVEDAGGLYVDLSGLELSYTGDVSVGVAAEWNPLPRVPKAQDTNQKVYKEEAARILSKNGLAGVPVKITQIVRMDLEGDGVEEAVIAASNFGMPVVGQMKNTYSLVLLRRVVKGKVQTSVLQGKFYTKSSDTQIAELCRLHGALDLDGDGVQEIVTYCEYYEGDWLSIFKVDGGKVTTALEGGCGV